MYKKPDAIQNAKTQNNQIKALELLKVRDENRLLTSGAILLVILYAFFALIFPESEKTGHGVAILLLMAASAYQDTRERRISISIMGALFLINLIHTVFFRGDYLVWLAAAVFSGLMLFIYLIKRKAVGLGDILLLALGMSSLAVDRLLSFLFLSFFLSSFYGIVLIALKKNREAGVPMAPCITAAWLAAVLILS